MTDGIKDYEDDSCEPYNVDGSADVYMYDCFDYSGGDVENWLT